MEDEYGNTPAQRAELDWLLYNKPLEYARWCWVGRLDIISRLVATMAGWKINDITNTARCEGEAKAGLYSMKEK